MVEVKSITINTNGPAGPKGDTGSAITANPPNIYREYDAEQSTPNNSTFAEFLAHQALANWPSSGTWTIDVEIKFDVRRSGGTSGDVGFYFGTASAGPATPTHIFSINVQDTTARTFVRKVRITGLSGGTAYYTGLYFRALSGGNTQYMRGVTIAIVNAWQTA